MSDAYIAFQFTNEQWLWAFPPLSMQHEDAKLLSWYNSNQSGAPPTVPPPGQLGVHSQFGPSATNILSNVDYGLDAFLPSLPEGPYRPPVVANVVNRPEYLLPTDNDLWTTLASDTAQSHSAPNDSRNAADASQERPHSDRHGGVSVISSANAKAQGDDHLFRSERSSRVVGSEAQINASLRRRRPGRGPDPAHRRCAQCGRSFTRNKNFRDHLLRHENRREYACAAHGCLARFNTAGDRVSHFQKIHLKTHRGGQKRR